MMSILKDAIDRIVELGQSSVIDVDGKKFANEKFSEVRPQKFYPNVIAVSGLDSIIKMTREEAVTAYPDKKIYIEVSKYNVVDVFTSYDEEMRRADLYIARADVPGFQEGFRNREQMIIQLRSLFQQTPDIPYLLSLISRMTEEESVTSADNGVTQMVEAKKGIALKEQVEVRPRVKLTPFRTFLEVDQPESEFLLRVRDRGEIGLFEADGGVWKLDVKQNIAEYLTENLKDLIGAGRVVVMM